MPRPRVAIAASVVLSLLAAACTDDGDDAAPSTVSAPTTSDAPETSIVEASTTESAGTAAPDTTSVQPTVEYGPATFAVRPGVNQLAVLGATPGETLRLDREGAGSPGPGVVDAMGSYLWRNLLPGRYTVFTAGPEFEVSDEVTVLAEEDVPEQSFYDDQTLPAPGFGYITTRDGTTLSANVLLPGPADAGPYPTVVEYSGYQPSDPGSTTFGQLFVTLGYAYVGVNMRGSGCSGGSYQFFERAQSIDGYDVIEAVAAQPWVLDHRVGMGGISYPGISQLFVASTQPPSLAAITPLSVIDDAYRATGYPGGILNTGFAAEFAQERFDEAKPYGQEWTKERADGGDTECADNQALRLQNPDFLALTRANSFYVPELADVLAPATFVDRIDAAVFLAGAWQDEQTGGHFADMLDDFTTEHLYVDLVNGLHTDSLSPTIFARMVEFLDLYVAKRTPSLAGATAVANVLVPGIFGVSDVTLPPDRFVGVSYEDALAVFEGEPSIRVLFEQGNAGAEPGAPYPRFIAGFPSWPVTEAGVRRWYLADNGVLATQGQTETGEDTYTADPSALPDAFYPGGRSSDIWRADTTYDWQPIPDGTGVGYTTQPLPEDTVVIGTGSVDLWIESSAVDTDLEVTISEVRPDGTEMYVQSGWLRASHRALDEAASTEILPVQTHAEEDAAPLPDDELTPVRIELFPFAYAFRAGNQIRITIDAPGNSRPVWEFETISAGESVTIAHGPDAPSSIALPVVPNMAVPPGFAPCGSLRGQPCRIYDPLGNEVLPI